MVITKKMYVWLFAAAVAFACLLCALPGMAFASPNVTVNYTIDGTPKSQVVDLATLSSSNTAYGYLFQKNDINNVVKADKTVTLQSVLAAAATAQGDDIDDIWQSGNYLTLKTDGGVPYTKYSSFTYDNLMATNYFYGSTLYMGSPLGTGTIVPTVFALQSGSQAMTSGQTAAGVLSSITTDTSVAPRLLWGYPSSSPSDIGGNRFPYNVDTITIS